MQEPPLLLPSPPQKKVKKEKKEEREEKEERSSQGCSLGTGKVPMWRLFGTEESSASFLSLLACHSGSDLYPPTTPCPHPHPQRSPARQPCQGLLTLGSNLHETLDTLVLSGPAYRAASIKGSGCHLQQPPLDPAGMGRVTPELEDSV